MPILVDHTEGGQPNRTTTPHRPPHGLARRVHFATSMAADLLSVADLEATLGVDRRHFAQVAVKELVNNALDAAEATGRLPAVTVTAVGDADEDTLTLTVADNGPGLPADVVARVLDFDHRVSDKRRYQTPSRGQQGNALKGIVGIAAMLGGEPVGIEACGIRHQIATRLVADHVIPTYDQTRTPTRTGTTVTLTVEAASQQLDLHALAAGYALANPHVTIQVSGDTALGALPSRCDSKPTRYNRTAEKCGKYQPRPDRFGSPWWYDAESFAGLVLATAELSPPPPLGAFLRSFDGLTSTARAKAVTGMLPVTSLAELAGRQDLIAMALQVMQAQAPAVPVSKLGPIGRAHLLAVFDQRYHVDGAYWYKKRDVTVGGVPWLVEVMVAETKQPARFHWLVNHAPVLSDPLSKVRLSAGQIWGQGLAGLLTDAYVVADQTIQGEAVVVSLVCPAPRFTDRGKTTMIVPPAVADAAGQAVWSTSKAIYRAQRTLERDKRRAARQRQATTPTPVTLKDAVCHTIPAAYEMASGGYLPVSCRDMYYAVRPLLIGIATKELSYKYWGDLLADYVTAHPGALPLLFYDPRGLLVEPHTEITVPLGTREVAGYATPYWLYNKILYVEKKDLREAFDAVQLAERYDLAICYGQGYAVEAARALLSRLQQDRDYQLFVLHDADLEGYLIADTLAAETKRMPNHRIEVVDLGLTVAQAVDHRLAVEERERTDALPDRLTLTDDELAWFTGCSRWTVN